MCRRCCWGSQPRMRFHVRLYHTWCCHKATQCWLVVTGIYRCQLWPKINQCWLNWVVLLYLCLLNLLWPMGTACTSVDSPALTHGESPLYHKAGGAIFLQGPDTAQPPLVLTNSVTALLLFQVKASKSTPTRIWELHEPSPELYFSCQISSCSHSFFLIERSVVLFCPFSIRRARTRHPSLLLSHIMASSIFVSRRELSILM